MEFLDISSIDGSENSVYGSVESHGKEILIISISIGPGQTEEITIHENDTPKFIAREFCRKHKLSPEAEKVIVEVIKDHLRKKPAVKVSKLGEKGLASLEHKKENIDSVGQGKKTGDKEDRDGKSTMRSKAERSSAGFEGISRNMTRRNAGKRLYNEALLHSEQYEKKISSFREKIQKDQLIKRAFRPSLTQDKKMESLVSREDHVSRPLDFCHILFNKSHKPISIKGTPGKFHSSSPNFSEKVLNSRKHLQHCLDLQEQVVKSNPRLKSPGFASQGSKKRVFRSQSNERKVKLSNEQTDKIINRIKTIRFVQLFENMNPNDKQEINNSTVQIVKLPEVMLGILKPFIEELRDLHLDLNLEQFCKVMELYLKDLTPEERSTLLQIGKKKTSQQLGKDLTVNKDVVNDLWSPKHEEKLLAFEQMPECA